MITAGLLLEIAAAVYNKPHILSNSNLKSILNYIMIKSVKISVPPEPGAEPGKAEGCSAGVRLPGQA
jgi:hypothetical protein